MATVWNLIKKYASQIGFTYNEPGKTYNEVGVTYSGKVKSTWNYQNKS